MKRILTIFSFLLLTACAFPSIADFPSQPLPITPTATNVHCAYVEGRKDVPKISVLLTEKLKAAGLPLETARAEAYGENCIAADYTVVSFSQREIDFYVTLNVKNLKDETDLGNLLEKILTNVNQLPSDQTGPNPGYVGIKFQSGAQVQSLWFMLTDGNALLKQGKKGAALYVALAKKP